MSGTRVGLVCGYLDPTRDGVADYTRRLAVHLRSAGLDPVVVTTHDWARVSGEDAVGVTQRWDVSGVVSAARAIRHMALDLVHVQFAPSVFGFSRAVGVLPRFLPRQIPLIVTLHEYGVWSSGTRGRGVRSALWSAVERWGYAERETLLLAPRATCLLVPSAEHLTVLRSRLPRHAPPTLEVPIGLNVEITAVDKAQARAEVRRALCATPDAPLVVFFGFLHPEKELDQLIAAVAAVQVQLPGTQLMLIGGEESHSVPSSAAHELRRRLEQIAASTGVQVHFTGYLPDPEVSRLLQAADVAAFPFSMGVTRKSSSLLAALAAGLPVVATAAPGERPASRESDGVFLVQPGDTAGLADALVQVLGDPALADRLTTAGRARAASHGWDAIAAAHAEVYARAEHSGRVSESWTGTAEPSSVVPSTSVEGNADVTA
ncbi:MAG TPA: glycosyltransferase family 4 protein [Jiangellaceae bacterium]